MSSSLNLTLTDELRAFVDRNCGDGTLYATPTEFMRDVLREKSGALKPLNCAQACWKAIKTLLQAARPGFPETCKTIWRGSKNAANKLGCIN